MDTSDTRLAQGWTQSPTFFHRPSAHVYGQSRVSCCDYGKPGPQYSLPSPYPPQGREAVPHYGSGFEVCPFRYRSGASVGRVRKAVCKWPCRGVGTVLTLPLLGGPPAERSSLGTSEGQSLVARSSIKTPPDTQGPPSPESILLGQSATSLDQRRISPPGFGPLNNPLPPPPPSSPRRSLFCGWLSLASHPGGVSAEH